ncbi:MAG: YegS/Rv2252/BmrU family lipid kinase [Gemmatimonadales bacterium]|nr:YegS/Rv2252/BmrU family lipid kinase [Gemmatimonadales bacterium]NIN10768.1 YegS/Rv2252/BmrU family lipid kinase [Gemmatimonadales bacterium]NIQ98998.1 YegS/Rv2252/BmrU family lipid kinase [Gemmatimonadales bacterium]NIS63817.1 YegS/Rv2252/BmrU family lipid kinase [Gemmatimonadales bacterium]
MARALLIFNPVAARTDPQVVGSVSRVFAAEGWELDVAGTTRPGHAAELACQGVEEGVDLIAIYGGDGTTMQAVGGIVGRGVPVGLIPGGTGNLLAGNLRLPRAPAAAAQVAIRGVPRRIDLGCLRRDDDVRYFAVACGAGFDAELMARTSDVAKRRWGMAAYVARAWDTLGEIRVVQYRLTVDDQTFEPEAATVLVANCGEIIPPFLRLNRGIRPDDGMFDVVALKASTTFQVLGVVWQLATGQAGGTDRVLSWRGRTVTVETEVEQPVELDGEPGGVTPFTAEIVPSAISVVVPGR